MNGTPIEVITIKDMSVLSIFIYPVTVFLKTFIINNSEIREVTSPFDSFPLPPNIRSVFFRGHTSKPS